MFRTLLAGLSLAFVLLLGAPSAQAQKLAIWKCVLPGGTYEVALRSINAISTSQYYIDGGIRITELNIDTQGGTIEARFYYMETIGAAASGAGGPAGSAVDAVQARIQSATDKASALPGGAAANAALNSSVIKNYPATTHAHTVEFRLASLDEVDTLFKSVESAWSTNTSTSMSGGSDGKVTTATGN